MPNHRPQQSLGIHQPKLKEHAEAHGSFTLPRGATLMRGSPSPYPKEPRGNMVVDCAKSKDHTQG